MADAVLPVMKIGRLCQLIKIDHRAMVNGQLYGLAGI